MYLFYILVCLCFMEENLYRGGEKKRPSIKKKESFLLIFTQAKVKMTRVQRSTATGLKKHSGHV